MGGTSAEPMPTELEKHAARLVVERVAGGGPGGGGGGGGFGAVQAAIQRLSPEQRPAVEAALAKVPQHMTAELNILVGKKKTVLEIRDFLAWERSLDAVPLVVELRQRGEEIRKHELDKARARLGPLTPDQEKAIDVLTSAIVNKILHPPTVHLKEIASNGHASEHVGFIRKLLGL